jgi:hypothetical protein
MGGDMAFSTALNTIENDEELIGHILADYNYLTSQVLEQNACGGCGFNVYSLNHLHMAPKASLPPHIQV